MSGQTAVSINPFNGGQLASHSFISKQQLGDKLDKLPLAKRWSHQSSIQLSAEILRDVQTMVQGRLQNTGPICIAAKWIIVGKSILTIFTRNFVRKTKNLRVGDPMDVQTDIGPMTRYDLHDELHHQVYPSIQQGDCLILCENKFNEEGNSYGPTI